MKMMKSLTQYDVYIHVLKSLYTLPIMAFVHRLISHILYFKYSKSLFHCIKMHNVIFWLKNKQSGLIPSP
jgi:hypothetical protein